MSITQSVIKSKYLQSTANCVIIDVLKETTQMILAIIIFVLTYVGMLTFPKFRPYIALGAGALFVVLGMLPVEDVLGVLDFNVLLMIAGTMGLVALFIESKMPALLADLIMEKVPNVRWAAVSLALFAGVISAFVDNVATVLMVAPVALEICKKLKVNPVPFIIAIAVSSNLQGAATLVGDTTAIMLGSALDMSFIDFFWYQGKPSIFFAVEIGAIVSAIIVYVIFRREKAPVPRSAQRTVVTDYVPSVLLLAMIASLIVASFVPVKPDVTNGAIACVFMIVGIVINFAKKRSTQAILSPLKEIDLETLGLLVGLFLIIGGLEHEGVIDALAGVIAGVGGGNVFWLFTIIVWGSVLISAFIDNIPYVATMIPVIGGIASTLGIDPTPLYFGLLTGATLGGNITPIGAAANITGIGILRRAGYEVKNKDFFKIGIPFTLGAIIPAYAYIWLIFGI